MVISSVTKNTVYHIHIFTASPFTQITIIYFSIQVVPIALCPTAWDLDKENNTNIKLPSFSLQKSLGDRGVLPSL